MNIGFEKELVKNYPFIQTFCENFEWKTYLERAVFAVWKDMGCPRSFQIPVNEIQFLQSLTGYCDKKGKFVVDGLTHQGYINNRRWHFRNALFDIKSDGAYFSVTYLPILSIECGEKSLTVKTLRHFTSRRAVIAPGTWQILPTSMMQLRLFSSAKEQLDGTDFPVILPFMGAYSGKKVFYGKFYIGGKPTVKLFAYTTEGASEFWKIYQQNDCSEAVLYTVFPRNGMFSSRLVIDFGKHNQNQYCTVLDMRPEECSFFPTDAQKMIRKKWTSVMATDSSRVALQYLQMVLDEHHEEIVKAIDGITCPHPEQFHGYCHAATDRPDCDITKAIRWNGIPSEQIPAAWTKLQRIVACGEYPFEMWQEN